MAQPMTALIAVAFLFGLIGAAAVLLALTARFEKPRQPAWKQAVVAAVALSIAAGAGLLQMTSDHRYQDRLRTELSASYDISVPKSSRANVPTQDDQMTYEPLVLKVAGVRQSCHIDTSGGIRSVTVICDGHELQRR